MRCWGLWVMAALCGCSTSSNSVTDSTRCGPTGPICTSQQVCEESTDKDGGVTDSRCSAIPAACASNVTCQCLVNERVKTCGGGSAKCSFNGAMYSTVCTPP